MKKYASLILFAFLLNGCDDGNMTVKEIEFGEDVAITMCTTNNLLYKLKSQETFILQMPVEAGLPTEPGTTKDYDIPTGGNGNYRAIYRAYDGALVADNICGLIPPSTPKVIEEWIATSGTIRITTDQKTSPTADDGSTKLTGYNYNINFSNITFAIPNSKPQTYDTYPFGNYSVSMNVPASLIFSSENAHRCTANGLSRIYNYNTSFFIMLDNVDMDYLIQDIVTPVGEPRTRLIGSTTNKLYYKAAGKETGSFSNEYFCNNPFPTSPSIAEDWIGQNGVEATSGIIEVATTLVGGVYFHTVTLKNVTMLKGKNSFKLPTTFLLGRL